MSALGDLEAAGAAIVGEGLKALAEHIWRSATGHTDHDADKKAIDAIKSKAADAAVNAALTAAQLLADQAGLALSLAELAIAAEQLQMAIREAETSPTIPRLEGLDMEIVAPGTLPTSIILNGAAIEVTGTELTYEQVIEMAKLTIGATVTFSYRKLADSHGGSFERLGGSLYVGSRPAPIVEGMVVNAMYTGNA